MSLSDIANKLRQLKQLEVVVGVTDDKGARADDDGITVLEKAVIHEFGSAKQNIPERSFLRSTFNDKKSTVAKIIAGDIKKVVDGVVTPETPLVNAGRYLAGEVSESITKGIEPPLKAQTIKRKGSSKPLIDTGALLNAITYEVRDKQ